MGQTRPVAIGPIVAGLAAIVLLGSLFVDWYEPGISAWTVFEALDLVLAVMALAAVAVAAQSLGLGLSKTRLPDGILLGIAAICLVIVVSQLINHPPRALARDPVVGIWLALAAAFVLLAGAALGSSYVSLVRVDDAPGDPSTSKSPSPDSSARPSGSAAPAGTPQKGPGEQEPPTRPMSPADPGRPG